MSLRRRGAHEMPRDAWARSPGERPREGSARHRAVARPRRERADPLPLEGVGRAVRTEVLAVLLHDPHARVRTDLVAVAGALTVVDPEEVTDPRHRGDRVLGGETEPPIDLFARAEALVERRDHLSLDAGLSHVGHRLVRDPVVHTTGQDAVPPRGPSGV